MCDIEISSFIISYSLF